MIQWRCPIAFANLAIDLMLVMIIYEVIRRTRFPENIVEADENYGQGRFQINNKILLNLSFLTIGVLILLLSQVHPMVGCRLEKLYSGLADHRSIPHNFRLPAHRFYVFWY